jgi:hypothetical protein
MGSQQANDPTTGTSTPTTNRINNTSTSTTTSKSTKKVVPPPPPPPPATSVLSTTTTTTTTTSNPSPSRMKTTNPNQSKHITKLLPVPLDTLAQIGDADTTNQFESNTTNNSNDDNDNDDNDGMTTNQEGDVPMITTPGSTTSKRHGNTSNHRKSVPGTTAGSMNKTYIQFVEEAIMNLKEYKTGSSLASIKKWIITNYPQLDTDTHYFNSRINLALKNGCSSKPIPKFLKIRCSYRITPEYKNYMKNQKRKAQTKASSKAKQQIHKQQQQGKNSNNKGKASSLTTNKGNGTENNDSDNGSNNEILNGMLHNNEVVGRELSEDEIREQTERRAKRDAAKERKALAEARAKQIAERLRRRKFPMEDTKLHTEDKEYGVKAPNHVTPRPYLPYFWHVTLPLNHPGRFGKTNSMILTASKVENVDYDSRGIVPDLLHIYHFFRGDVHFTPNFKSSDSEPIVPNFTLQQLIYCIEQVVNGTMKRTKCVPPLLVHLFVTCLQILTQPIPSLDTKSTTSGTSDDHDNHKQHGLDLTKDEKQLRNDLSQYLYPALSPASFSDVTYLYMDAMQRFYTTDVSRDPNVLQPYLTDLQYLFSRTDEPNISLTISSPSPKKKMKTENTDGIDNNNNVVDESNELQQHPLPEGYVGYLGDERSSLYRAHGKLARQDPWLLTAEEILALLRALTEDVLATHPSASQDMEQREEQMSELLKNKRLADQKLRKVRLAYEGPKKQSKPKPKSTDDNDNKNESVDAKETSGEKETESYNNNTATKTFVPTATKKQYDAAVKAQEKANDAYEKGIRALVARTEPVGYDRNYNAVYCFLHDPDILYVEEKKPPSTTMTFHTSSSSSSIVIPLDMQFPRTSWHVIETTSLCDKFASSLDIRGRREFDLYEVLMGPSGSGGTNQSLYRFLHDDLKAMTDAKSKVREKEMLLERLKMAHIKCDEEKGRRSGRLAGQAEIEVVQIQSEIDELERTTNKVNNKVRVERDLKELTGYYSLRQFETSSKNGDTRRMTRDKKVQPAKKLPILNCSKLCQTGNIDGTGLVGMLVSNMLDLEDHCNLLAEWDRTDISRSTWISRLENAVSLWHTISPDLFGSTSESLTTKVSATDSPMDTSTRSQSKRDSIGSEHTFSESKRQRKTDSPSTVSVASNVGVPTVSSIIAMLKQPLLDLEERVADITNVALATKDADIADENMSTDGLDNEINRERIEMKWKRLVHKLRQIPARRNTKIRNVLVEAISAAREAHLSQVVTELRAALLLYRPSAANDCKMEAIQVLISHGDYDAMNDDDADIDSDEENNEAGDDDDPNTDDVIVSVLSAEAAILRSSLGGSEDARREDWVGMVKSAKTLSRLASLITAFIHDATEKINKIEAERDELVSAIQIWSKAEERQSKQRDATLPSKMKGNSTSSREIKRPSEVWANVRYTDEICMAKTEEYPWWPAKMCVAKDPDIAQSLKQLKRSLVAFIGEMGSLRVVKTNHIRPFTGKLINDTDVKNNAIEEYSKDIRKQLDDCMAMARRIERGLTTIRKR